jgi:hypothetical protein
MIPFVAEQCIFYGFHEKFNLCCWIMDFSYSSSVYIPLPYSRVDTSSVIYT